MKIEYRQLPNHARWHSLLCFASKRKRLCRREGGCLAPSDGERQRKTCAHNVSFIVVDCAACDKHTSSSVYVGIQQANEKQSMSLYVQHVANMNPVLVELVVRPTRLKAIAISLPCVERAGNSGKNAKPSEDLHPQAPHSLVNARQQHSRAALLARCVDCRGAPLEKHLMRVELEVDGGVCLTMEVYVRSGKFLEISCGFEVHEGQVHGASDTQIQT